MTSSRRNKAWAWAGALLLVATFTTAGASADATSNAGPSLGELIVNAATQASGQTPSTSPFAGASASGDASSDGDSAPTVGEILAQGAQEGSRPGAGTSESDPGLIALGPDASWVEGSESVNAKRLSGSLLAIGLNVAVAALCVGAVTWGAERAGAIKVSQKGLSKMGQAVGASVALGALSGLVGFGFTLM